MKKKSTIYFLILTLSFQINLYSQDCLPITKHLDLDGEETVWNSAISKERSIYLCGTLSRTGGVNASFLVKTDTLGNVLWSRVMPGSGQQLLKKVYPTSDSGVITSGISSTYPSSPRFAAMVIKWDKNGNRQWSRSINANSANGEWAMGIFQTSDGGYLISGSLNTAGFQSSATLFKVSSQGVFQWAKSYTYNEGVVFKGAIEENDSYIIAGEYLFNSNTAYRPLIVKVNKSNGNVLLIKSFTLPGNVVTSGELIKKPNGGYFYNGMDLNYSFGFSTDYRQVIIYLNSDLNFEKAIRIRHATIKNQNLAELIPLSDGGFISSSGGSRNDDDANFYRVNVNGEIIWKRKIGGFGGQQLTSSSLLGDSSIIFVGNTSKTTLASKDILWLRTSLGSNVSACDMQDSDAVSEGISITDLSFNFGSVNDLSSNLWVSINPAIQEDVHTETYNCEQDCNTPKCEVVVKNFDIGGNERVWSIATSPDNHVYMAGGTERSGGIQASFVVKTDSAGTLIWSRAIPGSGQQFFRKVKATKDSGAIAVGLSRTYPSSVSGSAIVVKWNKNGTRQWSRSYRTNAPSHDNAFDILETSDGGYVLLGTINSSGFTAQGFAMKLDKDGNAQWIKHYPYGEGTDMVSALEVEDGYLISGSYLFNSNATYGVFVIKISKSDGAILQTKSWQMPDLSKLYYGMLHKTASGFNLSCTQLLSPLPNYFGNINQVVLQLDNSLQLVKATRISHNSFKNGLVADILQVANGAYFGAAGGENELDDVDIYKISSQGEILWKTRYGGTGGQNIYGLSSLGDSAIVLGGTTSSLGSKNILWLRVPLEKQLEGCDIKASDAVATVISVNESNFSYFPITNGNLANWVLINPAIESDNFSTTYFCGQLCTSGSLLPLRFISVNGVINNNSVDLKFETANEINVSSLVIERSDGNGSFVEIGTVVPKGNVFNTYEFSDDKLFKNGMSIFYRIKAIDKDGKLDLSKVIRIDFNKINDPAIKIYPNPSDGNFQIQYISKKEQKNSVITILNMEGKQIAQFRFNISKGMNVLNVSSNKSIVPGLYYIKFDGIDSKKILIR